MLAWSALGWSAEPLKQRLFNMADDPDPRVRFQLALTLGEIHAAGKIPALAKIARRDAADPWVRTAILSSVNQDAIDLFDALSADPGASSPAMASLTKDLATVIGSRSDAGDLERVIRRLCLLKTTMNESISLNKESAASAADWDWFLLASLQGLAEGIKLGEEQKPKLENLRGPMRELQASRSETLRAATSRVAALILPVEGEHSRKTSRESLTVALDDSRPQAERIGAIQNLSGEESPARVSELGNLLDPSQPDEIQLAVLDSFRGLADAVVGEVLIERWHGLGPKVREKALDVIFARRERVEKLLAAVASEKIPASNIDRSRQAQLANFPDADLAAQARKLFARSGAGEKSALLEKYKPSLNLKGDPKKGSEIHKQRCAQCHKVGEVGFEVGPNWSSVRANPPEQILANILDPNLSIQPGYTDYVIETTGGRVATGILAASSPTSLLLRRGGGDEEIILRKNIKSMSDTKLSLMPEGLEDGLSVQDMADLLAFLLQAP